MKSLFSSRFDNIELSAPRMTNVKETETTTSTTVKTLTPLMEVKCRENLVDLRYVVNNVDNMQDLDASNPSELVNFPPKVTVSGTDVRVKEVVLVMMALCLLVCSMCLFFKHWKKNYRDINQVRENSHMTSDF